MEAMIVPKKPKKNGRPGQDYSVNDPLGWCGNPARGAAMGRGDYRAKDPASWEGKLYVSRVYLNDGGYDKNGTYFGHGAPIYWIRNADYEIDYVVRAADRPAAIVLALEEYPKATFTNPPKPVELERAKQRIARNV